MVDIDIDSFGEHQSRPEEATDEIIPLDPVTPGGPEGTPHRGRSTWEPERGDHSEESLKEPN